MDAGLLSCPQRGAGFSTKSYNMQVLLIKKFIFCRKSTDHLFGITMFSRDFAPASAAKYPKKIRACKATVHGLQVQCNRWNPS